MFKRSTNPKWLRVALVHQRLFPQSGSRRSLYPASSSILHYEEHTALFVRHLVTAIQRPTATTGLKLAHCCQR